MGNYFVALLGADFPGSPSPAKSSDADGVEWRLSLFLRLRPALECRRVRFFQVWREFDAMVGFN
jgi:hypothetical protein